MLSLLLVNGAPDFTGVLVLVCCAAALMGALVLVYGTAALTGALLILVCGTADLTGVLVLVWGAAVTGMSELGLGIKFAMLGNVDLIVGFSVLVLVLLLLS
jgi:hypothetical protein